MGTFIFFHAGVRSFFNNNNNGYFFQFVDNVEETFQLHSAEGDDKQGRIQSRSFKQALSNCCGTSHGCIRIQSCEIKEASEHIPPSIWMYFDGVSFKKFVETVSELCPVSERVVHVNTSSE